MFKKSKTKQKQKAKQNDTLSNNIVITAKMHIIIHSRVMMKIIPIISNGT